MKKTTTLIQLLIKQRSKRSTDDILTMPEKHRLESYWSKYHEQLPSDFDTLYSEDDTCYNCNQIHREKRFISALIKGLRSVTRGTSIFGRLISSVKKIGSAIFKGIHGLFHHRKVQAIYRAVNTFKKYHSKLKIGELFKFKSYHDLHISKVSLYDKLNKALHKFGKRMNHRIFFDIYTIAIKQLGTMMTMIILHNFGHKVCKCCFSIT